MAHGKYEMARMVRTLIIGGTGRLGSAVAERLQARGDRVFTLGRHFNALPESINYAIFCQRYRGPDSLRGEFDASAVLTAGVLKELGFADIGDCAVVIVSSVHAVKPGQGSTLGYQMGKAAALAACRYFAGALGVRVNAVSPTGFTGEKPTLAMGEVLDVVEFLASAKSAGINGHNIVIDKGLA
jgi:NAD(P)-dependent dehydrogenase (short-subunit alcohol dehydrogenase family)